MATSLCRKRHQNYFLTGACCIYSFLPKPFMLTLLTDILYFGVVKVSRLKTCYRDVYFYIMMANTHIYIQVIVL